MKVNVEKMRLNILADNKGFSLIEIISVLVILGILTIVAVNRFAPDSTDLVALESSFKSQIRYTQSLAMQNNTTVWGIRINNNSDRYWLFSCDVGLGCAWAANRTQFPGDDRVRIQVGNGLSIGLIEANNSLRPRLTLVFDEMGVPFWRAGGSVTFLNPLSITSGLNRVTTDISIRLDDDYGNQRTITIAPETGFVQ